MKTQNDSEKRRLQREAIAQLAIEVSELSQKDILSPAEKKQLNDKNHDLYTMIPQNPNMIYNSSKEEHQKMKDFAREALKKGLDKITRTLYRGGNREKEKYLRKAKRNEIGELAKVVLELSQRKTLSAKDQDLLKQKTKELGQETGISQTNRKIMVYNRQNPDHVKMKTEAMYAYWKGEVKTTDKQGPEKDKLVHEAEKAKKAAERAGVNLPKSRKTQGTEGIAKQTVAGLREKFKRHQSSKEHRYENLNGKNQPR